MKIEVQMPKMGESITEGRILNWLKKPGDAVDRDETILEIATDKVDTEVPSPSAGVIVELLAAEGDTVEVGTVIAVIESDASQAQPVTTAPAKAAPVTSAAAPSSAPAVEAASVTDETEHIPAAVASDADLEGRFFSPVVLRIAGEHGTTMAQLASISGTGAHGRVTKNDLLAWLKAPSDSQTVGQSDSQTVGPVGQVGQVRPGSDIQVVPMSNMQRLMAEHMVHSVHVSPHVALVSEADLTQVVKFRDANADTFKAREGFTLTFMPFIAQAVVRAIKDFPLLNSSVDGTNILMKRSVNLGIAVAMDDGGLIVPVVKHADTLNETGLARAVYDVAKRARTRKLQPEEIQDGTFTITNFGVFGNIIGIPIINQPQVAILGVGALVKKPVVIERGGEDVIAIRSLVQLSLSFDHRLIDGALGGKFLQRVVKHLESFDLQAI